MTAVTWTSETQDKWYKNRCEAFQNDPSVYPRWKLVRGRLYYYRPDDVIDAVVGDDDAWKLVIPKEHRRGIIKECHDEPTAGHAGRQETFTLVAKNYYWPRF